MIELSDRQADDRIIIAMDRLNEFGGIALNGVGTGFIHRLVGGDVLIDLLFA